MVSDRFSTFYNPLCVTPRWFPHRRSLKPWCMIQGFVERLRYSWLTGCLIASHGIGILILAGFWSKDWINRSGDSDGFRWNPLNLDVIQGYLLHSQSHLWQNAVINYFRLLFLFPCFHMSPCPLTMSFGYLQKYLADPWHVVTPWNNKKVVLLI